jgi:hypothetical protein
MQFFSDILYLLVMETALFEEKNTFLYICGAMNAPPYRMIEAKVVYFVFVCSLIEAGRDGESQSTQSGNGPFLAYIPSSIIVKKISPGW